MTRHLCALSAWVAASFVYLLASVGSAADSAQFDPTSEALKYIASVKVGPHDWPQWGGSPSRNNVPDAKNIPITWDVDSGQNIKWSAALGSETYGNPVVANGKVYVGTNNGAGYLKRYPTRSTWASCCVSTRTRASSCGSTAARNCRPVRVNDWPNQGICSHGDGGR